MTRHIVLLLLVLSSAIAGPTFAGEFCGCIENPNLPRTDPARWGAFPSDGIDDTCALQHAIDSATGKTHEAVRHALQLKSGVYHISKTLRLPRKAGLKIVGAGALIYANPSHQLIGQGTAIAWTGGVGEGEPMIELRGMNLILRDIAFWGKPWTNRPVASADIGFVCTRAEAGLGTGKVTFDGVHFYGFKTAVQASYAEGEKNNDNFLFAGRTVFADCHAGLKVMANQNMGFHFVDLQVLECDVVFDFVAGGGLKVDRVLMKGETAPEQEPTQPNAYPVYLRLGTQGGNNGYFVTESFKCDGNTLSPRLLEAPDETFANVSFTGVHLSKASQFHRTLFEVRGRVSMTLREAFIHHDKPVVAMQEGKRGGRPNVHFERVRFNGMPEALVDGDACIGAFSFSGAHCIRPDGTPIDAWHLLAAPRAARVEAPDDE